LVPCGREGAVAEGAAVALAVGGASGAFALGGSDVPGIALDAAVAVCVGVEVAGVVVDSTFGRAVAAALSVFAAVGGSEWCPAR
jgi:hypothetical protein